MYGNTAACNTYRIHSHNCLKRNYHLLFHINETTIEPTCCLITKIWYDFKLLNMSQNSYKICTSNKMNGMLQWRATKT